MPIIRSLLWIGPGEDLARDRIADSPLLDVTWMRHVDEALGTETARYQAVVLASPDAESARADVRRLRRRRRWPPILVRLRRKAAPSPEALQALLAAGAADVLLEGESGEPPMREELAARLDRLVARAGPEEPPPRFEGVLAHSPAMHRTLELVARAAGSRATVLLEGETGTGKEILARALHAGGPRRTRPFVAVNCAAFPDTLLESELFGHARGAFTGADRDKKGLFEVADGGTLFLDEIGETSRPLQAKLLRALQEREVRPVGGSHARAVDVRVVAATNRDLRRAASRGEFRDDLYYRLAVFPVRVPPLRERRQDILPLAEHFLALHGRRDGKPGCRLSPAASHLLVSYRWPGNVRELENEMQRVLALAEPGEILSQTLLSERLAGGLEPVTDDTERPETLRESLDRVETWLLRRALERNEGRKTTTARELGLTREGLYKKLRRLGIA